MTLLSSELASMGEESELYLIHRLDRVVGGLLVFARSKKCAAELSVLVKDGELCKEYLAVCEGKADGGEMVDYLCKNSAISKAVIAT
jgi:23S rRNA pseudouridine1911/1915/1917 synthase